MRALVALSGIVFYVVVYLISFSRTPYRGLWALFTLLGCALVVMIGFVAQHTTIGGLIAAVDLGGTAPAYIFGALTEITCAENPDGQIRKYRNSTRFKGSKWVLSVEQQQSSNTVVISIRKGDSLRVIGWADPIIDYEEYVELKVRAKDIADTYNREGIA